MQNFFSLKSKNVGNGDTVNNELEDGNKCYASSCDDPSIPLLSKGKAEQTGLGKTIVHRISFLFIFCGSKQCHYSIVSRVNLIIQQSDCHIRKKRFFFSIFWKKLLCTLAILLPFYFLFCDDLQHCERNTLFLQRRKQFSLQKLVWNEKLRCACWRKWHGQISGQEGLHVEFRSSEDWFSHA